MPKIYSEEFKASALELFALGMTRKQVCEDLGISKSFLQLWVSKSRAHHQSLQESQGGSVVCLGPRHVLYLDVHVRHYESHESR